MDCGIGKIDKKDGYNTIAEMKKLVSSLDTLNTKVAETHISYQKFNSLVEKTGDNYEKTIYRNQQK